MGLRYAVTGSEGQLGCCLVRGFERASSDPMDEDLLVAACSHRDLDIGDAAAVARVFEGFDRLDGGPPDVLVNAAAYNAVDRCESDGLDIARRVNAEGPGLLAAACERSGTRLVHVSSDYVLAGVLAGALAGDSATPLPETAPPAPASAYGRSKLEGERNVRRESPAALIVRTSWVFGPGRNFPGAILRQARLRRSGEADGPLTVVDDQLGCPTYAADLASGIRGLVRATGTDPSHSGIYHLCNALPDDLAPGEATSWWDFARAILDRQGYADLEIARAATSDLNLAAARPRYSVLACGRAAALGVKMRPWPDALDDYLASADLWTTLELTDGAYWADRPRAET
jgi:dTDP-4-dehydrorhamnose reductase